jgi:hypothetical protein
MHTVELLEEALDLAGRLGYTIRQEWMGGGGGGGCELRGQRVLFLDLGLAPEDQLDQVIETLRREPGAVGLPMAQPLRRILTLRKSA